MNKLYYGDNLDIMREHIGDASVDLIYIDPPFNSKRDYNIIYDGASAQAEAFKDTWSLRSWGDEKRLIFFEEAQRYSRIHGIIDAFEKLMINSNPSLFGYLVNMSIRLVECHRVLKDTGSFYLHCDPTISHYLKLVLDEVFGRKNFRNEIVWCYFIGGRVSKKNFGRRHDDILFYTKGSDYTFNWEELLEPWSKAGEAKFRYEDEKGKYRLMGRFIKNSPIRGYRDVSPKWEHTHPELVYRHYLKKGKMCLDYWNIPPINQASEERLRYPTQKPEALLERIIKASSNEGDTVLDTFCGCGTTVAVAQRLNRRWIGIDITFLSIDLIRQRLLDRFYRDTLGLNEKAAKVRFNREITIFGIPRDLAGARQLATETKGDRVRKEFEKWAIFSVGGVYFEKRGADTGVDGYSYIQDVDKNRKLKKIRCLIQVKSGKVGVKDIRDFSHTLDREESPVGIFITLETPTKPMLDEVSKMPQFQTNLGRTLNKMYIVTIQDIIDENLPNLPLQRVTKQAARVKEDTNQNSIF